MPMDGEHSTTLTPREKEDEEEPGRRFWLRLFGGYRGYRDHPGDCVGDLLARVARWGFLGVVRFFLLFSVLWGWIYDCWHPRHSRS